ncbi:unnamed protein product, partial [Amoebophrya sp. A25]|eukprot:GSA25T00018964001.1
MRVHLTYLGGLEHGGEAGIGGEQDPLTGLELLDLTNENVVKQYARTYLGTFMQGIRETENPCANAMLVGSNAEEESVTKTNRNEQGVSFSCHGSPNNPGNGDNGQASQDAPSISMMRLFLCVPYHYFNSMCRIDRLPPLLVRQIFVPYISDAIAMGQRGGEVTESGTFSVSLPLVLAKIGLEKWMLGWRWATECTTADADNSCDHGKYPPAWSSN